MDITERDRRERRWIQMFTRNLSTVDAAKTDLAAMEVVHLLERASQIDSRFVASVELLDSQARLIHQVQNRGEYVELFEKASHWLTTDTAPLSNHGTVLVLAATLVHIVEGGLKNHLRLIWWAGASVKGEPFEPDWESRDKIFLIHALDGVRKALPIESHVRKEFEPFWDDSGQNVLNRIRRGLAHADFEVIIENSKVGIEIEDRGEVLFLSGQRLVELGRRVLDVEMIFHIAFHLGKSRIDGDLPYLPDNPREDDS